MDADLRSDQRWSSGLVVATILLLGLSLIRPPFPDEQPLQHGPTVAVLVLLAVAVRKRWLSAGAVLCLAAFVWLHILGARYIYSNVPYDQWSNAVFGRSLSQTFAWQRNHYDRLVHFCFGVLFIVPLAELFTSRAKTSYRWSLALAVCGVMTISAMYEIAEWLIAITMSPEYADAYNGQQGDPWDAQKDMALALAGATAVAAGCLAVRRSRPAT